MQVFHNGKTGLQIFCLLPQMSFYFPQPACTNVDTSVQVDMFISMEGKYYAYANLLRHLYCFKNNILKKNISVCAGNVFYFHMA